MSDELHGIMNVLKPPGMTSSHVVAFLRRTLGVKKIGHTGTLDPDAAGVLPICIGRATRLFDYIVNKDKQYLAELTFGVTTDTLDISGRVQSRVVPRVRQEQLLPALERFLGEVSQIPPQVSAIRIAGERAYEKARKGEYADVQPRLVQIHRLEVLDMQLPEKARLLIDCSKGTYIRSLARDIGQTLGDGAAISFLLRTRTGIFHLEDASSLEEIKHAAEQGRIASLIHPMDAALQDMHFVDVPTAFRERLANGNPLLREQIPHVQPICQPVRLYCQGELMGIASWKGYPDRLAIQTLLCESGNRG